MGDTHDYIPDYKPVAYRSITAMEAAHRDFHFREHYETYLLLEGEIVYYVGQPRCLMKSGDLILFTDQEIHEAVSLRDVPYTRMVIHIDSLYTQQLCTSQINLPQCFHQHKPSVNNIISLTPEQLALLQERFRQTEENQVSEEYGADIQGTAALTRLLLMINETFLFLPDRDPEFYSYCLQPVMTYTDSHLTEPITLSNIAQMCLLDRCYLSYLFKRETGSTISQYVLMKQIAVARELLSMGTSVMETYVQSGFGDYANFIRAFKKVTGNSSGYFKGISHDVL